MKVDVDRSQCMQNGECALAAPNVFKLVDDELTYEASPDESERTAVEDAASACPMQAISVLD